MTFMAIMMVVYFLSDIRDELKTLNKSISDHVYSGEEDL